MQLRRVRAKKPCNTFGCGFPENFWRLEKVKGRAYADLKRNPVRNFAFFRFYDKMCLKVLAFFLRICYDTNRSRKDVTALARTLQVFLADKFILGCRQAVRLRTLTPSSGSSNLSTPAKSAVFCTILKVVCKIWRCFFVLRRGNLQKRGPKWELKRGPKWGPK